MEIMKILRFFRALTIRCPACKSNIPVFKVDNHFECSSCKIRIKSNKNKAFFASVSISFLFTPLLLIISSYIGGRIYYGALSYMQGRWILGCFQFLIFCIFYLIFLKVELEV